MLNDPGRNDPDRRRCPSCGIRYTGPMKYCPECGVGQLSTTPRPAQVTESATHHTRSQIATFASVIVFALVFSAWGISYHTARERPPAGARLMLAPQDTSAVSAMSASAGTIARNEAASTRQIQAMAAVPVATHKSDIAGTRMDVARSLASARASLDKNHLWPARRAIMKALAEQPDNAAARRMQAELVSREHERDELIADARSCARKAQWACARQNADQAHTIDASSNAAKELLSRAASEHG
jgi:hypothetical protein